MWNVVERFPKMSMECSLFPKMNYNATKSAGDCQGGSIDTDQEHVGCAGYGYNSKAYA